MKPEKTTNWNKNYTYVIVANAVYILVFYLIMNLYS